MVYCLAVWCPHSAASCPLVAVEDSLNSSSTPPAREWQVPTASPSLKPRRSSACLHSRPSGCLKLKKRRGCPPVRRGWREREGKVKDSQDPIRFFVVCGLQLFRAYLFSLADLQMNKVRAVLLPAGCTSKETEGGSGLRVMVSIWPWPPGLGRWCYVVTAPRRPLVAPPFRPCLGKRKRAITLEEVSFHFKS